MTQFKGIKFLNLNSTYINMESCSRLHCSRRLIKDKTTHHHILQDHMVLIIYGASDHTSHTRDTFQILPYKCLEAKVFNAQPAGTFIVALDGYKQLSTLAKTKLSTLKKIYIMLIKLTQFLNVLIKYWVYSYECCIFMHCLNVAPCHYPTVFKSI